MQTTTETEPTGENATTETHSDSWEQNHRLITEAIADYVQLQERMPGKTELATKTGLSRATIHRHLKEMDNQPELEEKEKEFRIMYPKVLAAMCKYAMNGDTRAARIYFDMIGKRTNHDD
jgi:DNA-binding IclR family transcriptional regulator